MDWAHKLVHAHAICLLVLRCAAESLMGASRFNARLAAVLFALVSAGLSIVLISLGKVVLAATTLVVVLLGWRQRWKAANWQQMWTPRIALTIVFVFALSLIWTSAPLHQALGAVGKYGKFLVIPCLLVLIRTRREAEWAVLAFLLAQAFLLCSSWLLFFHVPLVWATSHMALGNFSVFSSYLDQGIMSATMAAVFWHLKALAPNRPMFYAAVVLSLLALGLAFIVFIGRTGYLVAAVMVSLAIFWALPRRYRLVSLLVPPLVAVIAVLSVEGVAQRVLSTNNEIAAYSSGIGSATSADNRLDFWKGSAQAIAEKPWLGSGVGSWATEYNRVVGIKFPGHQALGIGGNPHQEYFLWGVQLGVGGIVLLLAFFAAAMVDFSKMERSIFRAGLSVLAALATACLFNSSIYDAYIGDFFCLSLGVLLAYGSSRPTAPPAVA